MNDELRELLLDIQEWMRENDYECGEIGSDVYRRISMELASDLVDKRIDKLKEDWDRL